MCKAASALSGLLIARASKYTVERTPKSCACANSRCQAFFAQNALV